MNPVLVNAIEQKRRLRFSYNGKLRLVEPQCYGISTPGNELLRVHQLQGGRVREPLFSIARIADLEVLDEVFDRPGPNYKKNDSAMKIIFAQL
jgi:predicted DNA-binding transcriptional regulator YafY